MLTGKYLELYRSLSEKIESKRMFHDPLHTLAFGTDASFYRMIPKLVVHAKDEEEVSFLLRQAAQLDLPVTFRAAGTSLSGQAISDSVLLIAGEHWKSYEILEDGQKIRLQPGLIGSKVNTLLAPYRKKIGPDPASIPSYLDSGLHRNDGHSNVATVLIVNGLICKPVTNEYDSSS